MTTLTVRSATEVEQQLVAAGERAGWSEYMAKQCAGVAATCRWLLGLTNLTPATTVDQPADSVVAVSATWTPDAVTLERMRARRLEDDAARDRDEDAAAVLHGVAYTLAWYLRDPAAEVAPLP